ncbi:MAG TPA: FAD-dependent oxidoreductase, partial [Clostridiales bacterium]|nr:FAD-dependent oxidoreductase [Clostridiales bacterium]
MSNENSIKFSGVPASLWIGTTSDTNYASLEDDTDVDVAIVGAGITGLTTAYLLRGHGIRIAVIEANRIAKGVSAHTTAKITSQHALKYYKMINVVGEEKAKQYAQANQSAIDLIDKIIHDNNIDCDFKRVPAYVFTQDRNMIQKLEDETGSALRLGLPAEYAETLDLPFGIEGAMKFTDQAYFHPRKYLLALAGLIEGEDCKIYENTRAVDIREGDPNIVVTDNGRKIRARYVVQATRYPFFDKPGLYFARVYPQRTYLMALRIRDSFPEGMYINAEEPTRTLRPHTGSDISAILVGGENHKTGHGKNLHNHYEIIRDFAKPMFDIESIPYRWSAQD